MKNIFLFAFILFSSEIISQIGSIIPPERRVDWRNPGLSVPIENKSNRFLSVIDYGAKGDGISDDTNPVIKTINDARNNINGLSIVYFPSGIYLIKETLSISGNILLKGAGSDKTQLSFLLDKNKNPFVFRGSAEGSFIPVVSGYTAGSLLIGLQTPISTVKAGDYIELVMSNGNWKQNYASDFNPQDYVGQIIKVESVTNEYIFLKDKLSLSYTNSPRVRKVNPVSNSGIEDLKIYRVSSGKGGGSNFIFSYAANCWIKGVESDNTSRYHMEISGSTGIEIKGSYFHHAEDYGDGGFGYGIAVNFHSTNCLIENNIFQRLRHAMLLQIGANRNVFGYNYSREQHSTYYESVTGSTITTTLGDVDVHAHYPYANLFEGNVIETISVDDYWGDNGPINTFFRNRVTRNDNLIQMGGIHIKANMQNIIGNVLDDISDQFYYTQQYSGNLANFNGQPGSMGDAVCSDISYYYESQPAFLSGGYTWPPVGTRTAYSTLTQNIPAAARWNQSKKTVSQTNLDQWNITTETPVLFLPADGQSNLPRNLLLKWQKIKGAGSYLLQLSLTPDFSTVIITDSLITDTSKTVSNLTSNTTYYWRVKGRCIYGEGNFSNSFRFSTLNESIYKISGYVTLNNQLSTLITDARVTIIDKLGVVKSTISNLNGYFEFSNLQSGMYIVSVLKEQDTGGINSADALMVAQNYVGMLQLDAIQKCAADVNNNGIINSADALLIQKKFMNSSFIFPNNKPDWVFRVLGEGETNAFSITGACSNDTVWIYSSDAKINIKGLCSGDINGSYKK